nr:hypothetical protein CFP56_25184 [Quercus suber]
MRGLNFEYEIPNPKYSPTKGIDRFWASHVHSLFSLTKQPSIRASERAIQRERERSLFIRILGFPSFTTDAQFRNSNLRIWSEEFWLLVGSI